MEQRIVCAAIRNKAGHIIIGIRHYDPLMRSVILRDNCQFGWSTAEQGFMDNLGNFLSRKEAWIVAEKANQIIRRVGGDTNELYSENLY